MQHGWFCVKVGSPTSKTNLSHLIALRDLQAAKRFNVILVTHDLRESVFLADTVYCMSKSPGRFVVQRHIDLPRPRDLEVTYTPHFTDIVHELRGHIGASRQKAGTPSAAVS